MTRTEAHRILEYQCYFILNLAVTQAPCFVEFRDKFSELISQRRETERAKLAESRRRQDAKLKSRPVFQAILKCIEDTRNVEREDYKRLKVETENLFELLETIPGSS
jgi:hypothetical protein